MYCSISDAWSQENTMANLARRFNKEHFDNAPNQMEFFKINNHEIKGNDNSPNYGDVVSKQNVDTTPKYNNIPQNNLNTNKVVSKQVIVKEEPILSNNLSNNLIKKEPNLKKKIPEETKYKEYTSLELVDKVLSCNKCRHIIMNRLNISNYSFTNSINNLFTGTNKEVIILILIGLIIIILLDLFLRVGKSLN